MKTNLQRNNLDQERINNLRVEIKTICHSWFWERISVTDEEIEEIIDLIENLPSFDWNLTNLILKIAHWEIVLNSQKEVNENKTPLTVEWVKKSVEKIIPLRTTNPRKHTYMWNI